jgi:hypothetical protein
MIPFAQFSQLRCADKLRLHLINAKVRWMLNNMNSNNQLDPLRARQVLEELDYELESVLEELNHYDANGARQEDRRLSQLADEETVQRHGSAYPWRKR